MNGAKWTDGSNWYDDEGFDSLELDVGLKVRISRGAFPGSVDPDDMSSRGAIGEVTGWDEYPETTTVYVKVAGLDHDLCCDISELSLNIE